MHLELTLTLGHKHSVHQIKQWKSCVEFTVAMSSCMYIKQSLDQNPWRPFNVVKVLDCDCTDVLVERQQ